MSIALSDLVEELKGEVPAQEGTPSQKQYEKAIRVAVDDFSNRTGMIRIYEISVVSGTAVYTLPSDFLKEISLESVFDGGAKYGNNLVTSSGIVPLSNYMDDDHIINGQTLTFYPTPTFTGTRYLRYKAAHVLDDNGEYPYMTEQMASIIMLKAQAAAWRSVGARVGRQGWRYSFGDVTIDKTKLGDALQTWIMDFDREYDKMVDKYVGTVGRLG